MGRIVSNFFMALDGVVEAPDQWHFPYFNDEMGEIIAQGMSTCDAFLMGRVLYEQWSDYWTTTGEGEFAEFINSIPKYVLSNTLKNASWNNTTIISGDVDPQLRELKANTARDITMSGSISTARWLLEHGLVDELALLVHPIAVGHGTRLFEDTKTLPFELKEHQTLATGVILLTYGPTD